MDLTDVNAHPLNHTGKCAISQSCSFDVCIWRGLFYCPVLYVFTTQGSLLPPPPFFHACTHTHTHTHSAFVYARQQMAAHYKADRAVIWQAPC